MKTQMTIARPLDGEVLIPYFWAREIKKFFRGRDAQDSFRAAMGSNTVIILLLRMV